MHAIRKLLVVAIVGCASQPLLAQKAGWQSAPAWHAAPGHPTLTLWPNGAPGNPPGAKPERELTMDSPNPIAGRPVVLITDVSKPTITLYAPGGNNTGAAVVVFPGGAYHALAIDLEGTEVCAWLNSVGVNCILLKYRVPDSGPYPESSAALQDAQRALGLVRLHAGDWHIDPHRVGVLGFSAGGHLVAALSAHFDTRLYRSIDSADRLSCRPDFAMLVYPAYLWTSDAKLALDASVQVRASTPPTFLVQAEDDPVNVENSIVYFVALKKAAVSAEMHIYAEGGHGFGLRRSALPVAAWPQLAEKWFHTIHVLPAQRRVSPRGYR